MLLSANLAIDLMLVLRLRGRQTEDSPVRSVHRSVHTAVLSILKTGGETIGDIILPRVLLVDYAAERQQASSTLARSMTLLC